nr:MAG TPA: hypothetical protein [Caudoviricetes sp.]
MATNKKEMARQLGALKKIRGKQEYFRYAADHLNELTWKQLAEVQKYIGKTSNERLRALDRFSARELEKGNVIDIQSSTAYLYARRKTEGRKKTAFWESVSRKRTLAELRKEFKNTYRFYTLKESTVGGYHSVRAKQFATLKERYGDDFIPTYSDYEAALQTAWASNLSDYFGSEVIAMALAYGVVDLLQEAANYIRKNMLDRGLSITQGGRDYGQVVSFRLFRDKTGKYDKDEFIKLTHSKVISVVDEVFNNLRGSENDTGGRFKSKSKRK